ncbi:lipoprotein signal peptidase [Neisseria zoodegmatis]|uniref:lipoprotein signal peptidase n=1 Tax=Neisseria zoodegmatis TaxID=326523 RepID=UPI001E375E5D|nr:lipoprotein signal peptidase [Neisseria zoodegmatis]
MQNPHLRRISALCAARSFAYLYDMSALTVLLRLELHLHLRILQRLLDKISAIGKTLVSPRAEAVLESCQHQT